MKNLAFKITAALLIGNSVALAHEGHDHDAPTTLKAPKGGIVKSLDEARVEVVSKGKTIKVYLYNKEMKPAKSSEFNVVAKAELPRTKKIEDIILVPNEHFFEGTYDARGLHRYTLKLAVTDSKTSRTDHLTYTIEPRK